jgi:primary-amine oxidase
MTGRDPNGWGLVAWLYNDVLYSSTEEFRAAWASGKIAKLEKNASGPHVSTDRQGDALPMDDIPPPMMIQPAGQRFAIDHDQKYIEWGEFSFYVTFTRDTGMRLFDIKFKGERIIYELGLQEAIA